jgi:hypothetical protein
MDDPNEAKEPVDPSDQIRQFLEIALSPEDLQRLDALIGQLGQAKPSSEEGDQFPEMAAIREHLKQCLRPEELSYLQTLISQIDTGFDPDEHNDALEVMAEAARRRREASGMKENDAMTYAQDEASDLRLRLRAVGCPVGPYGNVSQLQSLWRHHIASRAGRGGGTAMASDAAWRRPPLPASLSFDAMYPGLRRRVGDGSGCSPFQPSISGVAAGISNVIARWRMTAEAAPAIPSASTACTQAFARGSRLAENGH